MSYPLHGGPLDGATAPAGDIVDGLYTITRYVGAPLSAFTASPVPDEEAKPGGRETVVYEIQTYRGRKRLEYAGGNTW